MSANTAVNVSAAKRAQMEDMVKGLLAKTAEGSGATIEEATAAAEKAQALAFKYGLDLLKLAAKEEAETVIIGARRFVLKYTDRWRKDLMYAVARGNSCKIVYHTGTKAVTVVGADHNIQICDYLHQYLEREILRLGGLGWRATERDTERSVWVNRFAAGAVSVLNSRFAAMAKEMAFTDTETTALVVGHQGAVEQAFSEMFPKLGKAKSTRAGGDGFYAGMRAGAEMALNAAMGGGRTKSSAGLLA